ncbi:SGNH/GDSL hydrolase family protein [Paenarthrobacter aurescens]|uniref:SGNH hydrolase-type esterase domain-containing protein n=1 Tax=Paenarthrobacter aurescens TaxID=43663 RepID=A0A4Y3N8A4_PAEAU|nr:SGNH/GDSL hydrolase family protein [Paenarthrobacter aurescens]MDO6144557.1 SGNH/GDSL hydrolase family protein [Paenarthrobacter aurescens]MDO6148402.1 SGNH/GDSL hydrolase family protein [Paenarthrobacter aurescens]MDO6159648.1 SGNH/GDSL hydrolase family protein [Paenarthrobacter aurescens]MDO6164550.1 SGNH/GDSL hydrolase family protein [Paenarthrobacter aurescens]GEB17782.1 hypothetical protein AAU01_05370 [Paenarthrobacter aurescens]
MALSRLTRRRLKLAAFSLGAALAVGAASIPFYSTSVAIQSQPPVSAQVADYLAQSKAKPSPQPMKVMAVLGDSFSLDKPDYWHRRAAACINYQPFVSAVGGSGFAQPGQHQQPFDFSERVEAVTKKKPDIIIFATAFNDAAYTEWQPEYVRTRTLETIATYKSQLPEAKIVIMGPFWAVDPLPTKITNNRDILAAAAKEAGVTYVDSSTWVRKKEDLADNDGQHPTASGHRLIADNLLAKLRESGLVSPNVECGIL